MAAGYRIDRDTFLRTGYRIHHDYLSRNSRLCNNHFNGIVVFLRRYERQQSIGIIPAVFLQYFQRRFVKRYFHYTLRLVFGLAGHIMQDTIDDIAFGQPAQITDPTPDPTLKNENVTLCGQHSRQVALINLLHFIQRQIIRSTVYFCRRLVIMKIRIRRQPSAQSVIEYSDYLIENCRNRIIAAFGR